MYWRFFLLPIFNLTANAADPGIIPGVTVSPQFLTTLENGMTDTITVYLNSQPTGDVIIPISSSDPGRIAVDKSSLVFTPTDYSIPQTVRFTSINNDFPDGKHLAIVILEPAESTDPAYDEMDPEDVSIIVNDDDPAKPGITPGVIVSPKTITMNENGSTATFTVCLNSRPTDNATITISSSDSSSITIDNSMVVFTITDYNIPQTVTVTSVDNDVADGKHQAIVILDPVISYDLAYNDMDPEDVSIILNDDDPAMPGITPGVIVSPQSITMNENGATATFTVWMNSRPTDDVTIPIFSSDPNKITIDKPIIFFTPSDYYIPQTVTVTSVDNGIPDGNHIATVILDPVYSTGLDYNEMDPDDVTITLNDDDLADDFLRIVATDPGNGAVGVPRNKIIRITFSEEIKEGYNFGEIKINKSGADMDFTYRINDSNLILNIKGNIPYASLCTVTIPVGAVEGQYGNSLKEEHSISFAIKSK